LYNSTRRSPSFFLDSSGGNCVFVSEHCFGSREKQDRQMVSRSPDRDTLRQNTEVIFPAILSDIESSYVNRGGKRRFMQFRICIRFIGVYSDPVVRLRAEIVTRAMPAFKGENSSGVNIPSRPLAKFLQTAQNLLSSRSSRGTRCFSAGGTQ
jgi:hypothetical protein